MKTTVVIILALLISMTFALYGCENTQQSTVAAFDKPQYTWGTATGQTITLRGNRDDIHRPYMLKALKRYQELTGNTVLLEDFSQQELSTNLTAAFITGSTAKPDLLYLPGGSAIGNLKPDENFYDFTDAPWVDDLTDTAINQTIINGKVIGLPYSEASISGILYNKAIFAQLGITIPRTQQEFIEVCELLLQNNIAPVYIPFTEPTMMLYQFPLDSIAGDPKKLAALNNGTLSYVQIPEMKKIVAWYKNMANKGYFGRNYVKNDWQGMDGALSSGRYAMMICWDTWLYTNFTGDPTKFGIMPTFMGVPEEGSFEGPNPALLLVNKNSPRLEAALDFLTFIADPFNYNVTLAGMYTAPVFKNQMGSISTPQYIESEQLIEKRFYDSTARPRIQGFSQLDARYIQTHMQDSTYSVEDCLRDMDTARRQRNKKNN